MAWVSTELWVPITTSWWYEITPAPSKMSIEALKGQQNYLKNVILILTNWTHRPWLGFTAKLHTQRGLRGFLLDVPPADWCNHKWKDHEASNGKNMSGNCFARVLLLVQHSLVRPCKSLENLSGMLTIPCISVRNTCFKRWKGHVGAICPLNHSLIEVIPHLKFEPHPFP